MDKSEVRKAMKYGANPFTTPDEISKNYPEGVTLNGFGLVEVGGETKMRYSIAETGQSFLAKGVALTGMAEEALEVCGSAEAYDAFLKEYPQKVKIHPVAKRDNGSFFRKVEVLEE